DRVRGRAVVVAGGIAGGDRAVLAEGGLQRCELLERRVGTRMLVARKLADGHELIVETARLLGGGPALLRRLCERVLVGTRDAVLLGNVLARLAHRLERELLRQRRVREPPAERRVVERAIAARKHLVRLRS